MGMDFNIFNHIYFLAMAIIFCPECGTQVSEHAQQCMKCSYPIYKLKNTNNNQNYSSSPSFNNINKTQPNTSNTGLIVAGYIVSFLSLFILPFFFLVVGIVIGIITISKGHAIHGIVHIVLSLLFGTLGALLGTLFYLLLY
jgi:ribosomal protein L40E